MEKHPSAYLLFLAFLVLTTAKSSSASSVNLASGTNVVTAGFVTCLVRRIPPPSGPPVAGTNVSLSCDGARTSLGQAVTNASGFYKISLNVSPGLLFNTTGCTIFVSLLLANFTSLPASGVVRAQLLSGPV
ncbi:uncharacterized protein LOC107432682 [Ziziphus jujuba]|uniref:Uncharacterized protein LOC107432682 n=1 Tax=Ziziphus jujuba TaxID=326968 RepID=A0A6P4ARR7_ZIZJJ|nr:uncharacterized protein LOC107432682 [Ziziphus jujuba]